MLPEQYSPRATQDEIDKLQEQLNTLLLQITMVPQASAPRTPKAGWVAISDGTGSGFDGSSGAGMYRYSGSAWVFVG